MEEIRKLAEKTVAKIRDPQAAIDSMTATIKQNRKLWDEIAAPAVRALVSEAVYAARHSEKRQIKRTAEYGSESAIASAATKAASAKATFITMFMVGGTPLCDCTRQEISAQRHADFEQANGKMANVRLYDAILAKLPDGKSVGEVFTNSAAEALWRAAVGKKKLAVA